MEFIFGENDLRVFSSKIRTRDAQENWKDPDFSSIGEALYLHFRSPDSSYLRENANLISPYIELVRHDWGLPAVKKTIQRLSTCGAPPRNLATASQISCRAGRNYEIALEIAGELWEKHPGDAIVSIVYAQALAAAGKFDTLDRLSEDVEKRLDLTPWAVEQWSRILLDCTLLQSAEKFTSKLAFDSLVREQNELRILSFKNDRGKEEFPLPTFILNLDRATRKWDLAQQIVPFGGYKPRRFSAIDGLELPGYALSRLGHDPTVFSQHGAGAIATALSHIAIWEEFLAGHQERCLILEDDATPFVHWSFHEKNLEATQSIDLLWANERMSQAFNPSGFPKSPTSTPWEVLGSRPANMMGLGTDAYLLTRNGAQKLLALFEDHGIRGHIDGQMGAYAIGNVTGEPVTKSQSTVQGLRRRIPGFDQITSTCLTVPLSKTVDHGSSNTSEISLDKRLTLRATKGS